MNVEREPFNPDDPMDAMSEMFRRQVTDIALDAYKVTLYRELPVQQQLECFIAGILTGLVGVCFASLEPIEGSRDVLMKAIAETLPQVREMAEGIFEANGYPLSRHQQDSSNAKG